MITQNVSIQHFVLPSITIAYADFEDTIMVWQLQLIVFQTTGLLMITIRPLTSFKSLVILYVQACTGPN